MLDKRNKISEIIFILMLASFLFTAAFGVAASMEMKDGQMSACPFMANQASMCDMGIADHIGKWQQAFLGVPAKNNVLTLIQLLASALAAIPFIKYFLEIKRPELTVYLRSYFRETASKIPNSLLLAFSDGILNPKIY